MSEPRTVQFFVPGEPRGKGRPRFGRSRSGHPVAYTDSKTAAYERLIRDAAGLAWPGAPTASAVMLNAEVRLRLPKSATKTQRAEMLNGKLWPRLPDIDNLCKCLMDGINGTVWIDDRQVIALSARKLYSECPGVDVTIREIG